MHIVYLNQIGLFDFHSVLLEAKVSSVHDANLKEFQKISFSLICYKYVDVFCLGALI